MTTLVWDETNARRYEAGVEHGVFYPSSGPGVVWDGLLSVSENAIGSEQKSYAENGVTYLVSIGSRTYQSTVRAFSSPEGFGECVGDLEIVPGFVLTRQTRKSFGFSYKTRISDIGYKIHIVYNATAVPTSRSYASTNNTPNPVSLEWKIDAIPEVIPGFRPTSHLIIDTTKASSTSVSNLEDLIYGTPNSDPYLPVPSEVINTINSADAITAIIEGFI